MSDRCKIICSLPNASEEISGIEFEKENGEMVAHNVLAEEAERFSEIPGYKVIPLHQQGSGTDLEEVETGDIDLEEVEIDESGLKDTDETGGQETETNDTQTETEESETDDTGKQDDTGDADAVPLEEMKAAGVLKLLKDKPAAWPEVLAMEEKRDKSKQRRGVLEAVAKAKSKTDKSAE